MLNCFHINNNGGMEILNNLNDAFSLIEQKKFVWIDFSNPAATDLNLLTTKLGIHPLTIEDCLDTQQIPKIDIFPDYSFFVFNHFLPQKEQILPVVEEVNFILGKCFLISVHGKENEHDSLFNKFRERMSVIGHICYKSPEFLLYSLVDYIVDSKLPAIESLEDEVEKMELQIHTNPDQTFPEMLLQLKKNLNELRKSIFHEREIFTKVCRNDSSVITEKNAIFYFKDIYDNLARYFELIEKNRETVNNLFSLLLSAKSNRIATISLQMNEVMKRLTVITTIFMPLTFFSGVGGMSEWSMICGPENWKYSYPLFFLLMLVFAIAIYQILKKLKWS